MPSAESEEKPSWGDIVEEEGEGMTGHLPHPTEERKGDTKIVTEHRRNDDGKLEKVVRTYKIETKKVSKSIARRKMWAKFGDAKSDGPGPNPSTTMVCDDVYLILSSNKEQDNVQESDEMKKLVGQKIVSCRICKGDHWTTKCPYKDQLENIQQQMEAEEGKTPSAAESAVKSQSTSGKYVAPAMRDGGVRRGEAMPRNQKDEVATIRVTNLSEDTREVDLNDLFKSFGPISRIFLAKDKNTNQSKGFAFINFVKRSDAARAIQSVSGYGYDHLILKVEWAKPSTNQ